MPRVALLTGLAEPAPDDNAVLLAPAFAAAGWQPTLACIDHLRLEARRGVVRDLEGESHHLGDFDLVWVLGFGRREGFLDKMQLIGAAVPAERCVHPVEALVLLHGKYAAAIEPHGLRHPETWASGRAADLLAVLRHGRGDFVIKPPGGSFGRDVHRLHAADPRADALIGAIIERDGWCLLQRWLPEVAAGEHRILIAGGRLIGLYRREATGDAANLALGGTALPANATRAQMALARRAAAWLATKGIIFAGLDVAGDQLLEVNVVNPGGLATLARLAGRTADAFAAQVVEAVLAAKAAPRPGRPARGHASDG